MLSKTSEYQLSNGVSHLILWRFWFFAPPSPIPSHKWAIIYKMTTYCTTCFQKPQNKSFTLVYHIWFYDDFEYNPGQKIEFWIFHSQSSAHFQSLTFESIQVLNLTNIVDEPCDISKEKAKVLENLPPIKTISIKIQLILQLLLWKLNPKIWKLTRLQSWSSFQWKENWSPSNQTWRKSRFMKRSAKNKISSNLNGELLDIKRNKYWREDSREDASVGKITTSSIPLLTSSVYAFQPNPTNTILPKDLPKRKFRIDRSKFNHASLPEMDKIAQPPSFIILPANNQPLSVSLAGNNIDNNDVTVHPISSKSLTPRPSTTTRRSTKCGWKSAGTFWQLPAGWWKWFQW